MAKNMLGVSKIVYKRFYFDSFLGVLSRAIFMIFQDIITLHLKIFFLQKNRKLFHAILQRDHNVL